MIRIYEHSPLGAMDLKELIMGVHYEYAVFGKCKGILLRKRGLDDNHVCLTVLTEDDELWHCGSGSGMTSSYWIDDLRTVLARAHEWLETNCDKDPSGFGYVFRSTK